MGIVRVGAQTLRLKILNGPFEGEILTGHNQLLGKLEMDKIFVPGDVALVVLTRNDQGEITYALPQDHYRLRLEIILFLLFIGLLLAFGGATGAKALLSFVLSALMIWKVMVPAFLNGYNPVLVSLAVVSLLCAVVIFLVGGGQSQGSGGLFWVPWPAWSRPAFWPWFSPGFFISTGRSNRFPKPFFTPVTPIWT